MRQRLPDRSLRSEKELIRVLDEEGCLMGEEFQREQRNYLDNPLAFWNRPDGDYISDDAYVPVTRVRDRRSGAIFEYRQSA